MLERLKKNLLIASFAAASLASCSRCDEAPGQDAQIKPELVAPAASSSEPSRLQRVPAEDLAPPDSTPTLRPTHILTAYLALNMAARGAVHLDDPLRVPEGLSWPSESFTLRDAISCVLKSGDDHCAAALGDKIAGDYRLLFSRDFFPNQAKFFGLKDTSFLDNRMLTTPHDVTVMRHRLEEKIDRDFPEFQDLLPPDVPRDPENPVKIAALTDVMRGPERPPLDAEAQPDAIRRPARHAVSPKKESLAAILPDTRIHMHVTIRANPLLGPKTEERTLDKYYAADTVIAGSDSVLEAHRETKPIAPGMLAKLMTLKIVYELIAAGKMGYKDIVSIAPPSRFNPDRISPLGLRAGQPIAVGDAIDAMLVAHDDAATETLAIAAAAARGLKADEPTFVAMMNVKARNDLGMGNTRYHSATGSWENPLQNRRDLPQITTAEDTLILYDALRRQHPQACAQMVKQSMIWQNQAYPNRFFNRLYAGNDDFTVTCSFGGYSPLSPGVFQIITGERRGIAVNAFVAGCNNRDASEIEATDMLDRGFAVLDQVPLLRRPRPPTTRSMMLPPAALGMP